MVSKLWLFWWGRARTAEYTSLKNNKLRKFAAVCSAPSIFLPSMQLAGERLQWEVADGQFLHKHRTSLPKPGAFTHTICPPVFLKEQTTPLTESQLCIRMAVFHNKTRAATQSHTSPFFLLHAEKFEEPAKSAQHVPHCPSHHYALDGCSPLVHSPQQVRQRRNITQRRGGVLVEPRLSP